MSQLNNGDSCSMNNSTSTEITLAVREQARKYREFGTGLNNLVGVITDDALHGRFNRPQLDYGRLQLGPGRP